MKETMITIGDEIGAGWEKAASFFFFLIVTLF
jgi:hypothetical protein